MEPNLTSPFNGNKKMFLSYMREDFNEASKLFDKLKTLNFKVWFDIKSLLGGQDWSPEIEGAIKKSKAFIVFVSKKFNEKDGFYHREIKYALECDKEKPPGKIYIIPLLLEDCEIPVNLKDKHCIRYYEINGFNNLIKTLNSLPKDNEMTQEKDKRIPSLYEEASNPNLEDCIAPYSNIAGSECAVRLSPLNYPTILNKVRLFITDDEEPNTEFKVNIYGISNNNRPGVRLNKFEIFGKDGNGNKWVEIDISEHKIFISKGDFFVSMEWLKAPGEYGDFAQFVKFSKNPNRPGRTFLKHGKNGKWWKKNSINCWIHAIDSMDNVIIP